MTPRDPLTARAARTATEITHRYLAGRECSAPLTSALLDVPETDHLRFVAAVAMAASTGHGTTARAAAERLGVEPAAVLAMAGHHYPWPTPTDTDPKGDQ